MSKLFFYLMLVLMLSAMAFSGGSLNCGEEQEGDDSSFGGGGGNNSTDDDDDNDDPLGCMEAIDFIYENCSFFFYSDDGFEQSYSDAYNQCLALGEVEDRWKCRLNCAKGVDNCTALWDCLNYCP